MAAAKPDKTSRKPTSEQLRHDIDSGKTRDKVDHPDPAAAPLGTDDEAGGGTPSHEAIRKDRRQEKEEG